MYKPEIALTDWLNGITSSVILEPTVILLFDIVFLEELVAKTP